MVIPIAMTNREFRESNLERISFAHWFVLFAAFCVARFLHFGQKRRSGGRAVEHPMAVAWMVKQFGLEAQVVAILHDTIEDVSLRHRKLAIWLVSLFGKRVLFSVIALTNWSGSDEKYFLQIRNAAKVEPLVAIVKLADKLHVTGTPYNRPVDKEIAYLQSTLVDFWLLMMQCERYLPTNDREPYADMLSDLVVTCRNRLTVLFRLQKAV